MEVLQVVEQLGGVSLGLIGSRGEDLVEADAGAEEGDAALDEVLEDVGHGEVGDVGVGVLQAADGLDVLHDGGGDGHHVPVRQQRALRHARGAARVADHAEVLVGRAARHERLGPGLGLALRVRGRRGRDLCILRLRLSLIVS